MAMSFAILAVRTGNLRIIDPKVVEKSFPDFWQTLAYLGIRSEGEE
jgi:5-enolpyruvylshikimate-3-phosphate synthase